MAVEHLIFPWTMLSFEISFLILLIIGLVIWIWALVDCLKSNLSDGDKIIWILIIVLFHIFGAIVFLIISKSGVVNDMTITKQKKNERVYRDTNRQVLAGVSSGIAEYFNIDVVIIRLVWVVLGLLSAGTALIAYVIAAIIIPPKEYAEGEQVKKASKKTGKKASKKASETASSSVSKKKKKEREERKEANNK